MIKFLLISIALFLLLVIGYVYKEPYVTQASLIKKESDPRKQESTSQKTDKHIDMKLSKGMHTKQPITHNAQESIDPYPPEEDNDLTQSSDGTITTTGDLSDKEIFDNEKEILENFGKNKETHAKIYTDDDILLESKQKSNIEKMPTSSTTIDDEKLLSMEENAGLIRAQSDEDNPPLEDESFSRSEI